MNRTSGAFDDFIAVLLLLQLCPAKCVSKKSKPLSPQGCFQRSQSHQGEQKWSGFNLEHWGLNWVYGPKTSV